MKQLGLALVFIMMFAGLSVWSEESAAPSDFYPSALGFSAGTNISPYSIFNLHYAYSIGRFSAALNLGGMQGSSGSLLSPGAVWATDLLATLSWRLAEGYLASSTDLYACLYSLLNIGFFAKREYYYSWDTPGVAVLEMGLPVGVGIGIEGVLAKRLSFPLEVGFEYVAIKNSFGPFINGAVRYRF